MTIELPSKQAWMQELGRRTGDEETTLGVNDMVGGGGAAVIGVGREEMEGATALLWTPTEALDIDVVFRDFRRQGRSPLMTTKADVVKMLEKDSSVVVTARNGPGRTIGGMLAYDRGVTVKGDSVDLMLSVTVFTVAGEMYLMAPLLSLLNKQTIMDIRYLEHDCASTRGKRVNVTASFGAVSSFEREYVQEALKQMERDRLMVADAEGNLIEANNSRL